MSNSGILGQLALAGLEAAPKSQHRRLFAIFPDPQVIVGNSGPRRRLCERRRLNGRPLRSDRLPVGPHPLGIVDLLLGETLHVPLAR